NLIRSVSSAPVLDLPALLDAAIFNFLIGNNDAHGKNFSLLYETAPHLEPRTQLAPFYDLLSTEYYPDLSKKMAMKLGGEYLFAKVLPRHFERLADEAGYSKPQVRRRVPDLAHAIVGRLDEVVDLVPNAKPIADFVRDRCDRTIRRFS
ncbi:MAG TPA: HipA domain-containing protein, partial [Fimbriimonadaceae bacterium]|nr:HipA domain-containing protein [Fimbriimonadaceae bacterium]